MFRHTRLRRHASIIALADYASVTALCVKKGYVSYSTAMLASVRVSHWYHPHRVFRSLIWLQEIQPIAAVLLRGATM